MTRNVRIAAALAALALGAFSPARAEVDKETLYKHVGKTFSAPPGVEFDLRELKPSAVPGFDQGILEIRFQGNVQRHAIQLSRDGRHYILSDAFSLGPSPLAGLRAPDAPGAPQIYVATDAGHFFVGEMHDLSVDPDLAAVTKMNLKDAASRGPSSAPVTLVEFSDLECPYCSRAHLSLESELIKTYGKNVRWVFKHFPLTSIHPWAYNAAIAAACAQRLKPGSLWKFGETVFSHQNDVNPGNIREKSLAAATDAGVDADKFRSCYDAQESKPNVDADVAEAQALGVSSTPTFFINGAKTAGFRDFPTLKAAIDGALAAKTSSK